MYPKTIAFMTNLVNEGMIPGVNYLLYEKGKQVRGHLGVRELTPHIKPLDEQTKYDVASLTKVMLSNSIILKLLEENQLRIDDPLQKYLPQWHEETVTIRELLTHTSGINPYIKNRNQLQQTALIEALLQLPVERNKQGRVKAYTDTGTILLGFMIEHLYQADVHTIFKSEVLYPLGMYDSGFDVYGEDNVAPTEYTKDRGVIKGHVHDPKAYILKEHCGSAGLFTTLNDCWLFVEMMLRRGKLRDGSVFLKNLTIDNLLADWTPYGDLSRSLGWDLLYHLDDNHPILYHTGYTGTFMVIDIINQTAFIFLSNRVHPYDDTVSYLEKRDELINIYLKEQTKDERNDILNL